MSGRGDAAVAEEGGGGFAGGFVVVGGEGDGERGVGGLGAGADDGHAELEGGDALEGFELALHFGGVDQFGELGEGEAAFAGELPGVAFAEDEVADEELKVGGGAGRRGGAMRFLLQRGLRGRRGRIGWWRRPVDAVQAARAGAGSGGWIRMALLLLSQDCAARGGDGKGDSVEVRVFARAGGLWRGDCARGAR